MVRVIKIRTKRINRRHGIGLRPRSPPPAHCSARDLTTPPNHCMLGSIRAEFRSGTFSASFGEIN